MTTKERLHMLVDELSEQEATAMLEAAERRHHDPVRQMLDAAPTDDEPFTAADETALDEAYAELETGAPTMTTAEFRRRYA